MIILVCTYTRPAWRCREICKGDYILGVDGMDLQTSDAIQAALEGNRIPGSTVKITVKKGHTVSSHVFCYICVYVEIDIYCGCQCEKARERE